MIAVKVFIHPLCPGKYLIAVIDVSGRLWVKCYEVLPHRITETEGKQLHRTQAIIQACKEVENE